MCAVFNLPKLCGFVLYFIKSVWFFFGVNCAVIFFIRYLRVTTIVRFFFYVFIFQLNDYLGLVSDIWIFWWSSFIVLNKGKKQIVYDNILWSLTWMCFKITNYAHFWNVLVISLHSTIIKVYASTRRKYRKWHDYFLSLINFSLFFTIPRNFKH